MTEKRQIWYQSTLRGMASDTGEASAALQQIEGGLKDVLYYGKVLRIPRAEYGKDPSEEGSREIDFDALLIDIEAKDDGEKMEPVPGAIIERYEVFDQDSGDVLVMWRIPYRMKERLN